ncbi:hypothetical protein [Ideonella sp. YS5]|uniref:hypothetical protein n=1 Tax=Ideonella sp. YS5 TaxID=3453714 RepID=UPI003F6F1AA1
MDDAVVIDELRAGQQALADGIAALHTGRGNVVSDIAASGGGSYVCVQVQRDAVAFLKRSVTYEAASTSRPTPLARRMMGLTQAWPAGFARDLARRFPDAGAAERALDYMTKAIAARLLASGNCGEHARVVADARSRLPDAPAAIRIARSDAVDHAWAEALGTAGELRSDDVMLDAWMRTPAHLREDSHFGDALTQTRLELDDPVATAWMASVIDRMSTQLEHDTALIALIQPAAELTWEKLESDGVAGAEESVPINLKPAFLHEASVQAARQPALSAEVLAAGVAQSLGLPVAESVRADTVQAILQARDELLAQDAPTDPAWSASRRA